MSYTRVSVRASQEYPKHSPNLRILARLKKVSPITLKPIS
jgi:hypothetical protein